MVSGLLLSTAAQSHYSNWMGYFSVWTALLSIVSAPRRIRRLLPAVTASPN
ncbi:hypothetical protein NY08_3941 [Rhodococcus sp. B7740]|nr:hypothetical protein NY08_3941 [Rhodococcus sp. B7740]